MTLIAQTFGWEARGINRLILVSQEFWKVPSQILRLRLSQKGNKWDAEHKWLPYT